MLRGRRCGPAVMRSRRGEWKCRRWRRGSAMAARGRGGGGSGAIRQCLRGLEQAAAWKELIAENAGNRYMIGGPRDFL